MQIPLDRDDADSELAQRGLHSRQVDEAFPTFFVSAATPSVTHAMVREALDE